jgi:hypothetical protein
MQLLALTLLACSTHKNQLHVAGADLPKRSTLTVAEPVYLVDRSDADPFRENTTVGNVTFSGGYITTNDGRGLHNVSKVVEITREDDYREAVAGWLDGILEPTTTVEDPVAPKRIERRGTAGMATKEGHDNQSLPAVDYRPLPMGPLPQPTLVPWVVSYYTHNAGWFYGQAWGTGAGARVHVLLVAHDTDGSVIGWRGVDGARVSERVFSPSEPELQDLLIWLERKVGKKL